MWGISLTGKGKYILKFQIIEHTNEAIKHMVGLKVKSSENATLIMW